MKISAKVFLFIFLSISFFSYSFAEDFWLKLGWNSETRKINYCETGIFYISAYDSLTERFKLFSSNDSGYNWSLVDVSDYSVYLKYIQDNRYLYYWDGGKLYKYDIETGDNEFVTDPMENYTDILCIEKFNDFFFISNVGQIIKYNQEWSDSVIVFQEMNTELVEAIAMDSTGIIFAGTTDFMNIGSPGGIYRSFDNGDTWNDLKLENHFVTSIVVDSEGRIFAGTAGHYNYGGGRIFRSTDNGDSWQQIAGDGSYVRSLAVNSEDEIFTGLSDDWGFLGIAYSNDNGDSWSFLNEGLGGQAAIGGAGGINDIAVTPDGYVYLATDGGVYRSINPTTGIDECNNITKSFELYQNYPNPFNSNTNIQFSLSKDAFVELNVYNIKGELVNSLLNKRLHKGMNSIIFQTTSLNSGIYFYRILVEGNVTATKQMLYLK